MTGGTRRGSLLGRVVGWMLQPLAAPKRRGPTPYDHLVREQIEHYRALSYEQLRELEGLDLREEVVGPEGEVLIRETEIFWDDPTDPQWLRVVVDIVRSGDFVGRTIAGGHFVRAPDGSFVRE